MKNLLYFFVISLTWNKVFGIYGGCMSYSTSHTEVPSQFQVSFVIRLREVYYTVVRNSSISDNFRLTSRKKLKQNCENEKI